MEPKYDTSCAMPSDKFKILENIGKETALEATGL